MSLPLFLPSLSEKDDVKEWEAAEKKQKEADDGKVGMALKRKATNDVRGRGRGRWRGMVGPSKEKRRCIIIDNEDNDEEYEDEEVGGSEH
ncbi:hypothetical protein BU17DRAFT_92025 [Hysterangium stoloniferum]|nr:hypothetical protein BU17DRAFT_92025 [Hysterangium stoloniferum]